MPLWNPASAMSDAMLLAVRSLHPDGFQTMVIPVARTGVWPRGQSVLVDDVPQEEMNESQDITALSVFGDYIFEVLRTRITGTAIITCPDKSGNMIGINASLNSVHLLDLDLDSSVPRVPNLLPTLTGQPIELHFFRCHNLIELNSGVKGPPGTSIMSPRQTSRVRYESWYRRKRRHGEEVCSINNSKDPNPRAQRSVHNWRLCASVRLISTLNRLGPVNFSLSAPDRGPRCVKAFRVQQPVAFGACFSPYFQNGRRGHIRVLARLLSRNHAGGFNT
ncbi:uncharacterized protein EI90DRAFT_3022283 [Cantharellus anzutake]|uniref:uncharacterized protein n=1 Tax=Cantharellus anzutake TaxID=1750568 RepID=UPI001906C00C|nr:uncharacterized protein EI90DRAFT_3022283 [Cantharellus anzutake]KAF8314583.1 hypothetical protein EI90DRAFT_3022283 [Cantharellus anzutake]